MQIIDRITGLNRSTIVLVVLVLLLGGGLAFTITRTVSAKQKLAEANQICSHKLEQQQTLLVELQRELERSASACKDRISGERERCDNLVSTYREVVDAREEKGTIVDELKKNKAKAYEALYRRLGYLPDE